MTVLVLGGCGFIGSHLLDRLVGGPDPVRVFDRAPDPWRAPLPGIQYIQGDFTDIAALSEALTGVSTVYHLISTTLPATSNAHPVADIQGNLVGTVQLLDAMRQQNVPRIVFLSSGGTVYGIPQTTPIAEDHPLNPISSYGIVKVAIEKYLSMYQHLHGIQTVSLRASNPYGARQGHAGVQGVIGTFLWNLVRDAPIEIWGDGKIIRDFVHVGDLADLCLRAGRSEATGIFNAGAGEGTSILEIVAAMGEAVGHSIEPVFRPGRAFDVPRSVLDISQAREQFDWMPQTALTEGLREAWTWVQSAQD